jgi:hypothetical protein
MRKIFFPSAFLLFVSFKVFSQGEVPVNMHWGTPIISLGLFAVSSYDLSDELRLVYATKGLRVAEPNGRVGVSWDIDAGGSITREVRGLPDDFSGTSPDTRRGWLHERSAGVKINADVATFGNTADLLTSTCTDETADNTKIDIYDEYKFDTEPDIFRVNASGLSVSFVFDNSATPVIRTIPYTDIKIEPTYGVDLKLSGFNITTNTGVLYQFFIRVTETRYTEKLTIESTVEFNKTEFEQYRKSTFTNDVIYTKEWKLSKIISPSGDEISYDYTDETVTGSDTLKAMVGSQVVKVYRDYTSTVLKHLSQIKGKSGMVIDITTTNNLISKIELKDFRRDLSSIYPTYIKQFDLEYYNNTQNGRKFLHRVTETSNGMSLPPHEFTYLLNSLPPKESKSRDIWGYFNGKGNTHLIPTIYVYPQLALSERYRFEAIPGYAGEQYTLAGADRTVDTTLVQLGTLKTIMYPSGGITTLKFEANQYYDTLVDKTYFGGGVRIQWMKYHDAITRNLLIEKYFHYKDATSKTTGRLVKKPVFAIPTYEYRDPLSASEYSYAYFVGQGEPQSLWTQLTVRTESDLSPGESTVGYKEVKVSRPGSGYSIHEFRMPATYGVKISGDWAATENKFARQSSCPSMEIIPGGGVNMFPYAPNPVLDYERGAEWRKRDYSAAGALVREITVTRQYVYKSTAAVKVWGLRFERYPNADHNTFLFGKYFLLTDVMQLAKTETVKTYDAATTAKNITESAEYFYSSPNHKLLNKIVSTSGDGTISTTYLKYPLDYGTIPAGADSASMAIGTFQSTFRNGIAIETYSTIKKTWDSEEVVAGTIAKFKDFGSGKIWLQHAFQWRSLAPLLKTSFVESYVHATTKLFTLQSGYEKVLTNASYDLYGRLKQSYGLTNVPSTTVWGFNTSVPVVSTSGVGATGFAFSDFEGATEVSFTETQCSDCLSIIKGTGRTGSFAVHPEMTLSKDLTKVGSNYLFSGWIKHTGVSVTLNLKVQNTAKTITYHNANFVFAPTTPSGTFEFFEVAVPIDPALTTFHFECAAVSEPALAVMLDDVSLYPSHVLLSTVTYTFPFGPSSNTVRHQTNYSVYDYLGRIKYVMDTDLNIRQRNTWQFNQN